MVSNSTLENFIDEYLRYQGLGTEFDLNNAAVRQMVLEMYNSFLSRLNNYRYSKLENHKKFMKLFTAGKLTTLLKTLNSIDLETLPVGDEIRMKAIFLDRAKTYTITFQEVEEEALDRQAGSAQLYEDIQNSTDENIMFVTQRDARVSQEHAELDGVIKPKTDPFWDKYLPPLRPNCRCFIVPTNDDVNQKDIPTIEEAKEGRRVRKTDWVNYYNKVGKLENQTLSFNPAKTDYLFETDHTYIKNIKKEDFDIIKKAFPDEED